MQQASLADGQAWACQRFQGLTPGDFMHEFRVFTVAPISAPPGFADVWWLYEESDQELLSAEVCDALTVLLVICDPTSEQQSRILQRFILCVNSLGHAAPPILWIPHSAAPDLRPGSVAWQMTQDASISDLLHAGLDGFVPDEPEGLDLALAVRCFIHKSIANTKIARDMINERHASAQYAKYIQEWTHDLIWEYLRYHVAPSIPLVDFTIQEGPVAQVGNYTFQQLLGKGACGAVYLLETTSNTVSPLGEVMKVVDKSGIVDLRGLKSMKRMIDVMRLLSCDQWRHPNVVQLFDVYHSRTHLFFRMEFAGSENLFHRLTYRQRQDEHKRPMSDVMTYSVVLQVIASVVHLHLGPGVCHRDIKPENFIVHEEDERAVIVKLTDFDLALVQRDGVLCRSACGTFPFLAPEVILGGEYNGMQADIWSLGIVLFEVFCGIRVVEGIVKQDAHVSHLPMNGGRPADIMVERLKCVFAVPSAVANNLAYMCLVELAPMLSEASPMLTGMLKTASAERWSADQVVQASHRLPTPK